MEAKSCMSDVTEIPSRSRNHAQRSSQSEWQVHIWRCRYRGGTISPTPSNQTELAYHNLFLKHSRGFCLIQYRVETETAFSSADLSPTRRLQGLYLSSD